MPLRLHKSLLVQQQPGLLTTGAVFIGAPTPKSACAIAQTPAIHHDSCLGGIIKAWLCDSTKGCLLQQRFVP